MGKLRGHVVKGTLRKVSIGWWNKNDGKWLRLETGR